MGKGHNPSPVASSEGEDEHSGIVDTRVLAKIFNQYDDAL